MGPGQYAAYLRAYDLFEAVQGEDHEQAVLELEGLSSITSDRGWPAAGFVAAAALTVHAVARSGDAALADLRTARLIAHAEGLGEPAFTALALGLRAVSAALAGDTAAQLSLAARALALLEDETQRPLDRSMGYVVAGAAFNSLSLWELVDDLYDRAIELGPVAEDAKHLAAVVVNRVIIRLEWGLAQLQYGDVAEGLHTLRLAEAAVPAALAMPLRPLWERDVHGCADMVRALTGPLDDDLLAALAEHRVVMEREDDVEILPLLRAVHAFALLRAGRLAEAESAIGDVASVGTPSASSGVPTFPLWVRAELCAARDPSPAIAAQRAYAVAVSRLLWESRAGVLAAAHAQIAIERRRAEHERLTRDVLTDTLTGLHNRRSFESWLSESGDEASAAGVTALMLIDLDDFKRINDTFGHGVGDDVLRRIGEIMRSLTRAGDVAVRQGGDEFALILRGSDITEQTVAERAQRLSDTVAAALWHEVADGLRVRVSIGFALGRLGTGDRLVLAALERGAGGPVPDADLITDTDTLYRAADAALYRAKRSRSGVSAASGRTGA